MSGELFLNNISTEVLLDSVAQVSAISESWFKSDFDIPVRPISDMLVEVKFHIQDLLNMT